MQRGRIEDEFGFSVFLWDGVIAVDSQLLIRFSIGGDAVAENGVVNEIDEEGEADCGRQYDDEYALDDVLDAVSDFGAHRGTL